MGCREVRKDEQERTHYLILLNDSRSCSKYPLFQRETKRHNGKRDERSPLDGRYKGERGPLDRRSVKDAHSIHLLGILGKIGNFPLVHTSDCLLWVSNPPEREIRKDLQESPIITIIVNK